MLLNFALGICIFLLLIVGVVPGLGKLLRYNVGTLIGEFLSGRKQNGKLKQVLSKAAKRKQNIEDILFVQQKLQAPLIPSTLRIPQKTPSLSFTCTEYSYGRKYEYVANQ